MDIKEETARLSEDSYDFSKTHSGWKLFASAEKDLNLITGFAAGIYYRVDENGQPKLNAQGQLDTVLAIRGTDNDIDKTKAWIEIATSQKVRQIDQADDFYKQSIKALKTQFSDCTIKEYFTGHSLGGGEAEILGAKYGVETYTFNAIGTKNLLSTYNITNTDFSNIHNYATRTDVVSPLFEHIGDVKYVDAYVIDSNGNANFKVDINHNIYDQSPNGSAQLIQSQLYQNIIDNVDNSHSLKNFYDNKLEEATSKLGQDGSLTLSTLGVARVVPEGFNILYSLTDAANFILSGQYVLQDKTQSKVYIGTKTELEAKIKELNNNTDYDLYYGNNSKLSYQVPSLGESFGTVTVFADDLSDLSKAQPLLTISDFLNSKITYQQLDSTSGQYLNLNPEYDPSTINNSLLDFRSEITPTSNDATKSDMAWATEGAAIHGGDYKAVTDMNTINGNGFQNEQMMKNVTDQWQPGDKTLTDNVLDSSINNFLTNYDTYQNTVMENATENPLNADASSLPSFEKMTSNYTSAPLVERVDPLVLDLNGDGVQLVAFANSKVTFDVDNDGVKENTGWVSAQDGILVHDKNQNGIIDGISETISEYYTENVIDGLDALKTLDSNKDNVFNAQDTAWNELQVWQDANQNGQADTGELKTLSEAGVQTIDLAKTEVYRERLEGNPVQSRTTMTLTDGTTREVAAVDFTTNPIGYEWNQTDDGMRIQTEDGASSGFVIGTTTGQTVSAADKQVQSIYGNIGDDTLIGDDKDNWLVGGAGNDTFNAGAGNDFLVIDADDTTIDAGDGIDIVRVHDTRGVSLNLSTMHAEVVNGGTGDDVLIGGGSSNVFMNGGAGNDLILGGAADDALAGEDGDDLMDGGYGDDIIRGHRGNDTLMGGSGDDYLDGGEGDDTIMAGDGNDVIIASAGQDTIDAGNGFDMAEFKGKYDQYVITRTETGFEVEDTADNSKSTLKNIERLRFANVDITLSELGENSPPLPVKDTILVSGTDTFVLDPAQLLANDFDLEGDTLSMMEVSDAVGGTVSLRADGKIEFIPDPNFIGTMSFDYSVKDSTGRYAQVYRKDDPNNAVPLKAQVNLKNTADPTDPLYYDQWYLNEIKVKNAWTDYSGKGVEIGIFEGELANPFNYEHTDLAGNIDQTYLDNLITDEITGFSNHATLVAGVIAAEKNGVGSVGIAYDATLSSYTWRANADGLANMLDVDIANNSWAAVIAFSDDFSVHSDPNENATFQEYLRSFENATEFGRDGLGTSIIFAGGNERKEGGDTNQHNLNSNRFSITVGSINQTGDLSKLILASEPFSNPGASILISAPGSNIQSTANLVENSNGSTFGNDFEATQGTSFSTPIISGIVALMLEANPKLGYRDIQEILAYSARKIEDPNTIWQFNNAKNWNGGGLHYSQDYGYGIVDVQTAVRLAETWQGIQNSLNEESMTKENNQLTTIQDNGTIYSTIQVDSTLNIEHVEVTVDMTHERIGDLILTLIAPDGTESILMNRPGKAPGSNWTDYGLTQQDLKFTFTSTHHWGETTQGEWKLKVTDAITGETGQLNSWQLKFYGDTSQDNVYIFTSEFGQNDANNHTIQDSNGIDTLNASALLTDSVINLNTGEISMINGQELIIQNPQTNSTIIENAFGGDGNDTIIGNEAANLLYDGRGSDTLTGGAGSDTFKIKFHANDHDTITDFNLNEPNEKIDLTDFKLNSFTDLTMTQNGNDAVLSFSNDQTLTLKNVQANQLNATHFQGFLTETVSLIGTANADNLYGDERDNSIDAGAGNDYLSGDSGNNTLTGGTGSDNFFIALNSSKTDIITDLAVNDINERISLSQFENLKNFSDLNLEQQDDNIKLNLPNGQTLILQNVNLAELSDNNFIFYDQVLGSNNNNVMIGSDKSELIYADDGDDYIQGEGGSDNISGGNGNDEIYGGLGDDKIYGNDGNDELKGGSGNDKLYGRSGNDVLDGGLNDDLLDGGEGNDILNSSEGEDTLTGGSGNDTFKMTEFVNSKTIITDFELNDPDEMIELNFMPSVSSPEDFTLVQQNNDLLIEFKNAQTLVLKNIQKEELPLDRLVIKDVYYVDSFYSATDSAEKIYAKNNSVTINANGGNDDVHGSNEGDYLFGGKGNDILYGQTGDDVLYGDGWLDQSTMQVFDADLNPGNDCLFGEEGDDVLCGLGGNDILSGGIGNNTLTGGAGDDTFVITQGTDSESFPYSPYDEITDFEINNPNEKIDLSNIETTHKFSDLTFQQHDADTWIIIPRRNYFFSYYSKILVLKDINASELNASNFKFYNSIPQATLNSAITYEDEAVLLDILATATDADGDTLSLIDVTQPTNGTITIENNKIKYVPNAKYIGQDSFNYTITDSEGSNVTQTVQLNVQPIEDRNITGTNDQDYIYAGPGNDTVIGGWGDDTLYGQAGDDILDGEFGDDVLEGGAGNDILNGGYDNNTLTGGTGSDTFEITADSYSNHNIVDTITDFDINDPNEKIDLRKFSVRDFINLNIQQEGSDTVIYLENEQKIILENIQVIQLMSTHFIGITDHAISTEDLTITGSNGNDLVRTGSGNDTINGGSGNDALYGQVGNDILNGEFGNDVLDGDIGSDTLIGGWGDDTLYGQAGDDVLIGGLNQELIYYDGSDHDILYGGDGNDILKGEFGDDVLAGGAGNDILNGGYENNILTGGVGSDTFEITADSYSNHNIVDTITDFDINDPNEKIDLSNISSSQYFKIKDFSDLNMVQDGLDTIIKLASVGDEQKIILKNVQANQLTSIHFIGITDLAHSTEDLTITGSGGNDLIRTGSGNDTINSGSGNDTLYGQAGNDILNGGYGNDTLYGQAGDDILDGEFGDDVLEGGAENDILNGGYDNNTLTGGEGSDTFVITADEYCTITNTIIDFDINDPNEKIDLSSISSAHYSSVKDFLNLNKTQDGFDTIINLDKNQKIILKNIKADQLSNANFIGLTNNSKSTENLTVVGGNNNDALYGGFGNDQISGGWGNDTLMGGAGDDGLNGEAGDNVLIGGSGSDIFIIDDGYFNSTNMVKDFEIDKDKIDIKGLVNQRNSNIHYFLDLQITQENSNAVIRSNNNQYVITLENTDATVLNPDHFINLYALGEDQNNKLKTGTDSDNWLYGNDDTNTTLIGFAGNDYLSGENGNDLLLGGDGNDQLYGNVGDDLLDGGAGNDQLTGGVGYNRLMGGAGADSFVMIEFSRNEIVDFEFDNPDEKIIFNEVDGVTSFTDLTLSQLNQDTIIKYGLYKENIIILKNISPNQLKPENFIFNQKINGTPNDNTLFGDIGNDRIYANDGNDFLYGNAGSDSLYGENGNDTLYGDAGQDYLSGGTGDDVLYGNEGKDSLVAEDGNDTLYGGSENDFLSGGAGDDILYGEEGADELYGWAGNNTYYGGEDADTFLIENSVSIAVDTIKDFELNKDKIHLYEAPDFFQYEFEDLNITQDNNNTVITLENGHKIILENINKTDLDYTQFTGLNTNAYVTTDQVLYGSYNSNNKLIGGLGNDKLYGYNKKDSLYGGPGNDQFYASAGEDQIYTEDGDDLIFLFESPNATTIIEDFEINNPNEQISMQYLNSIKTFADLKFIQDSSDTLINLADNQIIRLKNIQADQLKAENFRFRIFGTDGADYIQGHAYPDYILAGAGDDLIFSFNGGSYLDGGAGNDIICGGGGDYFIGGTGNDIFVIGKKANAKDRITDFEIFNDKINLSDFKIISFADLEILYETSYTNTSKISATIQLPNNQKFYMDNLTQELTAENFIFENQSPIAQNDSNITVNEDESIKINLLANDTDDIDYLGQNNIQLNQAEHASVSLNDDGTVTYTPAKDFYGTDHFSYNLIDSQQGQSEIATVTIQVNPVNDTPTATLTTEIIKEDTTVVLDALATANDVDGDTLSVSSITQGDNGGTTTQNVTIEVTPNPTQNPSPTSSPIQPQTPDQNQTPTQQPEIPSLIISDQNTQFLMLQNLGKTTITDNGGEDIIKFDSSIKKDQITFIRNGEDLNIDYGNGDIVTIKNQWQTENKIEKFQISDGEYLTANDINQVIDKMTSFSATQDFSINSTEDIKQNQDLMAMMSAAWHA